MTINTFKREEPNKTYAQARQDVWAVRSNHWALNGFYVDLGAYDGLEHSNTALLDFDYGWQGICVEANVSAFNQCVVNRPNAVCVNACVAAEPGFTHFSGQTPTDDESAPVVPMHTLQHILDSNGARPTIDYMSIDIEGFEFEVLEQFDFSSYRVHLLTIEHNAYVNGPFEKDRIHALMMDRGFVRVVEDAICLDSAYYGSKYEDWYCNAYYLPSAGPEVHRQ